MLTKEQILKELRKNPERYWKVKLFEDLGFERKVCPKCGKGFWTLDSGRVYCPDPECGEEYGFLGNPITKVRWDYIEAWKEFEKFFVKNGHTSIPRYPVVAVWRKDLFFNIASIVDFQRFDEGVMIFEYPANPLIVPQMCLRFNDITNVGITGRHNTCFMMPGQHAFNWPKEGYWKDKTIELNFNFLTKVMGIPKEEIIYVEELWTMPDLSAFGPYLESFSRGLELSNSGFMEFGKHGNSYKELYMKVVDVGWGLERLVWFTNGTPTSYDVVFGDVIDKLKDVAEVEVDENFLLKYFKIAGSLDFERVKGIEGKRQIAKKLGVSVGELERKISPLEALYAIADHTRALVFAIVDGALPSNVGAGYYLRVILRRSLSFIEKFKWDFKLWEVCFWHIDYLKKIFPELEEFKEEIEKILSVEEERYRKNRERVRKVVERLKDKKIEIDELISLYRSQGISPEDLGIEAPPEFYQKLYEKHEISKKEKILELDVSGIPKTQILFYEPIFEFKAKVIKVIDGWVILDKSAFYPKSGGQDFDLGSIDGKEVLEVRKIGNVILHKVDGRIEEGKEVLCKIDVKRRKILTQHHDAIHIINGAARKILGKHVRQYGAEKTVEKARIDITHYQSISEEEVEKIEKLANEIVWKEIPIEKFFMERMEAERKFGFKIYQGGYVPSKTVRIVKIGEFDVEACSGTHGNNTREVELIKIIKTKRIADGVVRIEIVAGERALEYIEEKKKLFEVVKEKIGKEDLVKGAKEIFEKWKKLRKTMRKLKN
ncbi:MAG: alanine--tRNA ligase [Candidatus Aenigmarchaeota archaeon]|nr:alanine--tRNA ligase [Candidatus Aenigmarchaeota archaeon]